MMGSIQRFRLAIRQVRRSPGFTATAILTLALGIGGTTAVFSLIEGVLLRPLSFRQPDRLVLLGDRLSAGQGISVTAREIATYAEATHAFSSMGAFTMTSYELSGKSTPELVNAARLGAGVFPTLGVNPMLGRVFTREEEDAHAPLAVLSYALWLNRYGGDPHVLGESVTLDRRSYTIIGVMPRDFEFPLQPGRIAQTQLWVPLSLTADELSDSNMGRWSYQMVGRIRDGVTAAQAADDADRVAHEVMRGLPASMATLRFRGDVTPLREDAVANVRPILRALFFAVLIVLLIAALNVAGLLLVRAIRRRREYAVRLALGAGARVLLKESMLEGLMLSVSGGLLGLAFAFVLVRGALHLLPESMPRINSISIDPTVVLFALGLAIATGLLCSLAPVFASTRTNLAESIKEGDRTSAGSASHSWLRSTLVISEIAIALVLITTSGAFLRSFQKMRATSPGFQPDHVLVASYQLPLTQYPTDTAVNRFNRELVDRLSQKPGIIDAGLTLALPATNTSGQATYTIEGQDTSKWKITWSMFAAIYGDYFRSMNIPLIEGRYFNNDDTATKPPVVIVSQTMAQHSWPGQSPLGKRMHIGNPRRGLPWATVVGVVGDTKVGALDEPAQEQWYMPTAQQTLMLTGSPESRILANAVSGFVTLSSKLPPEQMVQTLRSTVAEIDPLLALQQVQPMTEVISSVEAPRRFNTDLITAFALSALLLSLIGIYAIVAFSVSLRNHEMAIRLALGAQTGHITRLVLSSGARMAVIGCALGVLGSLAVSRVVRSFLFEVSPTDPLIYSAGVAIMIALALLASALPAMRAAAADPVDALRSN